ncbi:MAG: DUF1553 domain-containing protein [Planctomycetes bacterium]|nr:DUF1553 domain-containing protein [Planctomycetota bacterium]
MTRIRLLFCAILIGFPTVSQAESPIDFDRDIKPILSDNCYHCHGPDSESREAELRLDQKDSVFSERDGYWIVQPGNLGESELIARLVTSDPDELMPPAESGKELTAEQIELMRRWVAAGAPWKEHWSFVPPTRPQLSNLEHLEGARNEIDYFIAQRLATAGLKSEPMADRRTLVRRLHLDLTGLPPTAEQVEKFLADNREDAYERLVEELLASPHFGERMTVAWLDQARYADTNGFSIDGGRHMWLWRDWVIHAYNGNMPFDQFVIEQLAGDLLPNATTDQLVATGFNRNHMITHEGGTIPAENLANYASDRVRTTAEVFLGLTMGCAQCHDHKYDPLTQRDYYRFLAYFNTLEDKGLDGNSGVNSVPKTQATSILGRDQIEARQLRRQLQVLEQQQQLPLGSQAAWEEQARREIAELGQDLVLVPAEVINVSSPNRISEFELRDDGTLFLKNGGGRSPSITAKITQENVTGLRLVFYPDPSFERGGLGYGKKEGLEGSFLLTSMSVSATVAEQVDLYEMIDIRSATATASHPDHPAVDCLTPTDTEGWSPGTGVTTPQSITFQFQRPIHASETPYLTVMLVWGGGRSLQGGKCRIFTLSGNDDQSNIPLEVREILEVSPDQRTPQQGERLRSYHVSVAPERANLRYQIANLKERLETLTGKYDVMVMNTAKKPRKTHILNRGQYDQPGEEVTAGVPAGLPQPPPGLPDNRLGLAQWLVAPDHPLTSRVAVNRLWQLFFGRGIVATSADFGSQGAPPTHPELLDWLAREFVDSGWDVKHVVKTMVMSAAYRQSSVTSPEKLEADPYNQWLSRGPRFRLEAEFVRDSVLQVSGLLANRIGGPSVRPYQPPNLWREISHYGSSPATAQVFVQDHGERLYRRSMYTYWKRTVPPPSMISFDAPSRETCSMQRERTNTPLQALVMLNDPQFVEASRKFAERILHSSSETDARIRFAFEQALARPPSNEELEIVRQTLQQELQRFREDPAAAAEYLEYGESDRDPDLAVEEHAAWTTVATLIFNLSEMITKG